MLITEAYTRHRYVQPTTAAPSSEAGAVNLAATGQLKVASVNPVRPLVLSPNIVVAASSRPRPSSGLYRMISMA